MRTIDQIIRETSQRLQLFDPTAASYLTVREVDSLLQRIETLEKALEGVLEVPEAMKALANWGDRELIAARAALTDRVKRGPTLQDLIDARVASGEAGYGGRGSDPKAGVS